MVKAACCQDTCHGVTLPIAGQAALLCRCSH
jgi:hypothetical protein